jgi:sugar lactone lactonase YvrE
MMTAFIFPFCYLLLSSLLHSSVAQTSSVPVTATIITRALAFPTGIICDANGYVYVADSNDNTIHQMNAFGVFVSNFTTHVPSNPRGQLLDPLGMALDINGFFYVTDSYYNRVLKFNTSGGLLQIYNPSIVYPQDVAVDAGGNVFIADYYGVVQLYPNGTQIQALTFPSPNDAGRYPTRGIKFNSAGILYLSDFNNHLVYAWKPSNNFSEPSNNFSEPSNNFSVFVNGIYYPSGITFDQQGNLFVASTPEFVSLPAIVGVVKVSPSGVILQNFFTTYTFEFNPNYVAVDHMGNLYLTMWGGDDLGQGVIWKFSGATQPWIPPTSLPSSSTAPNPSWSSSPLSLSSSSSAQYTANLCYIVYGLPGNIDYPWSSAISVSFQYTPAAATTADAVILHSASGVRTFTNRFGSSFTTPLMLAADVQSLLYINTTVPVDSVGLKFMLGSPVQLPGVGPSTLFSSITLHTTSAGLVVESNSTRIDLGGSAFLSSLLGFVNYTIGPSNVNSLAANYNTCGAPVTFFNGIRQATQPSASNGAVHFTYSYTLSDGISFMVQMNLSITASSAFAVTTDALGSPYQTILNITGQRSYTFIPTGETVTSNVSGPIPKTSNRFYPYSLISSSPGVYSGNVVPYLDAEGLSFSIEPAVPLNGNALGVGTQISQQTIRVVSDLVSAQPSLNELSFKSVPSVIFQRQLYVLK